MRSPADHPGLLTSRGGLWQRRSVFELLGARLLVSEMFSPRFMDETFGDKFFLNDGKRGDNT
jgi:chorismate-pyruvate lyase